MNHTEDQIARQIRELNRAYLNAITRLASTDPQAAAVRYGLPLAQAQLLTQFTQRQLDQLCDTSTVSLVVPRLNTRVLRDLLAADADDQATGLFHLSLPARFEPMRA